MDFNQFNSIKQEVLNFPICYREVEANEIIALSENHYRVGNATFEVDNNIARKIDVFAGLRATQTRMAFDSYGDEGVANLRNFFGQAQHKKEGRMVLLADTQDRRIIDGIPIKQRLITPDVFFDFAEMFMDKNNYVPHKVEYSQISVNDISILMKPIKERHMEFTKGDEFMSNGLFLNWTPGEISLGNYYIRLVCSNGAIQISRNSIHTIFSPEVKELRRLLNIPDVDVLFKENTARMLENVHLAMKTMASVRELGLAVKTLNTHGVEDDVTNEIIPYQSAKEQYESAGYVMDREHMACAKSNKTMWELFNILTFFATHNKMWSAHDVKRTSLMNASMDLLFSKRDIKEYYDIY